mgnify:CR=1 FL=1
MGRRGDDFDCFSKSEVEFRLLLEYIHKTDDRAFVTVTSIGEVLGKWNVHRRKKIEIQ